MATLKELEEKILLAMYHRYKSATVIAITVKKLCEQSDIKYESDRQLDKALHSLFDQGYIKAVFFTKPEEGLIQDITPSGIKYAEDHLRKLNKPDDLDKEDISYKTSEKYENIADLEANPCFGVETMAECFVKQLDKIASHENENFCMLGIFGPWGRGKTYFFNKIKKNLLDRKKTIDGDDKISYKIVEFNAWKYQDTPAIWAYLHEKLYALAGRWQKIKLWWMHCLSSLPSRGNIATFLMVILIAWILYFLMYRFLIKDSNIRETLQNLQFPMIWIFMLFGAIYNFINNPIPTYKYVIKYSRRKRYKSYLGIQNDLEKDFEILLTTLISKPKKEQLLLYVDDLDRCSTDKMLEVINSLRIILENPEIQKRLIVICSIDPDKLISGYCLQKEGIEDKSKLIEQAREHIDKLFVFGIGLSPLNASLCREYLQTIANIKDVERGNKIYIHPLVKQKKLFMGTYKGNSVPELTEKEILKLMFSFIRKHDDKVFTPRKLRIMYYRLLFANNLIAANRKNITQSIILDILNKSIDPNRGNPNMERIDADIVHTVVPY